MPRRKTRKESVLMQTYHFSVELGELPREIPNATDINRRAAVDKIIRLAHGLYDDLEEKIVKLGLEDSADLDSRNILGPLGLVSMRCTPEAVLHLCATGLGAVAHDGMKEPEQKPRPAIRKAREFA